MGQAIVMVAALDRRHVIGREGALPFRLPDDLRHFRELTEGTTVVMGRKTFASIGRPLPRRRNIVLSRSALIADGVEHRTSLDEVLALDAPLSIIGGGEIYRLFLPHATKLELTLVDADVGGDTTFPPYAQDFVEVARRHHPPDERHAHAFDFVTLTRRAR